MSWSLAGPECKEAGRRIKEEEEQEDEKAGRGEVRLALFIPSSYARYCNFQYFFSRRRRGRKRFLSSCTQTISNIKVHFAM